MSRDEQVLEKVSRVGFAAKGIVYTLLGVLAVMAAVGVGGQVGGSGDALRAIGEQPFGSAMLVVLALGLACYAAYRLYAAATGTPYQKSDHETPKRIGAALSGIAHGGLAAFAAQLVWSGQSSGSRQGWIATILEAPGGNVLIGAFGAFIIAGGLYQGYKAFTEDFMKRLQTADMNRTERTWLSRLGRIGLAARAVVLPMIGYGLLEVAMTDNPSRYQGVGASLAELSAQSYGNVLLALTAAGLAAYGAYMMACAKYRQLADEISA